MKKFEKNQKYDTQLIGKIVETYKFAKKQGDHVLMQRQANLIYEFTKKYVLNVLWENYQNILRNPQHHDDLIQSVWLKIFKEIENYDASKASITVFLLPWIRHAVTDYCSEHFQKTTVYYANGIQKVQGCINWCRLQGIEPKISTISDLSGISEATVNACMDILKHKNTAAVDSIYESEILDNKSKTPEEQAICNENTRTLNEMLEKNLSDFEIQVLRILVNPHATKNGVAKKNASYREIVLRLKREEGITATIASIKNTVSDIVIKLKDCPELVRIRPDLIRMCKNDLEEPMFSIVDDKEFIDLQLQELGAFQSDS